MGSVNNQTGQSQPKPYGGGNAMNRNRQQMRHAGQMPAPAQAPIGGGYQQMNGNPPVANIDPTGMQAQQRPGPGSQAARQRSMAMQMRRQQDGQAPRAASPGERRLRSGIK